MELYLVQHGEATEESENPERPLTAKGRADCERTAAFVARAGVRVAEIRHSAKLRAVQTAEIFERALGAPRRQADGLAPNDDVNPLRREVASRAESLMLVGHLPHLARLAGSLLAQDESMPVVAFHMGGVVKLVRRGDGRFSVDWAVTPEIVG